MRTTTDEATRRLFARLEARLDLYNATGTYPDPAPVDDSTG